MNKNGSNFMDLHPPAPINVGVEEKPFDVFSKADFRILLLTDSTHLLNGTALKK